MCPRSAPSLTFTARRFCRTATAIPTPGSRPTANSVPSLPPIHARYPNDQAATTLWYHDHALGITRLNVYAGLAGFYLIRDAEEDALNLPSGPYEIPLLIQDRNFGAMGRCSILRAKNGTHPMWMQEFFGDMICVNGKAAPFLEVEPRKYRFRLVMVRTRASIISRWFLPMPRASATAGRRTLRRFVRSAATGASAGAAQHCTT